VIPPARRPVSSLSILLAGILLAACSAAGTGPSNPPASTALPSATPVPTLAPSTVAPSVPVPSPSAAPGLGNVDRTFPELAVEVADDYLVTLTDPAARAWRVDVRGTGPRAGDRLELFVEVGDVAPGAEARIYEDGRLVDVIDMSGMIGVPTAAAGGCHPTLGVCVGTGAITLDPGTGRLTVLVETLVDESVEVTGATADWPAEPFILGPWRMTESFRAN